MTYSTEQDISDILDPIYDRQKDNIKSYPMLIGICMGLKFNTELNSPAYALLDKLILTFMQTTVAPAAKEIQTFAELVKTFTDAKPS